jgi:hypothetical protein
MVLETAGQVLKIAAFDPLLRALDNLTAAIVDGAKFSDKAQKASLALGGSLDTTRAKLSGSMDGLRGSIEKQFTAGIMMLDAGLRGNEKGVAKLINQQQLTGTAFQQTAPVFARLNRTMGLSTEVSNNMIGSLMEASNKYGVATDLFVSVIKSLEHRIEDFAILGLDRLSEAVGVLAAEVGRPFAATLTKAIDIMTETGTKGLQRMAILGLAGFRDTLQSIGKDPLASLDLLHQAFRTGSANFMDLAGGVNATSLQLGVAEAKVGPLGKMLVILTNQLNKLSAEEKKGIMIEAAYWKSLSTLKDEIFNPLKLALMELYVDIAPSLGKAFEKIRDLIQTLVTRLGQIYVNLGGLEGIIDRVMAIGTAVFGTVGAVINAFGGLIPVVGMLGTAMAFNAAGGGLMGVAAAGVFAVGGMKLIKTIEKEFAGLKAIGDKEFETWQDMLDGIRALHGPIDETAQNTRKSEQSLQFFESEDILKEYMSAIMGFGSEKISREELVLEEMRDLLKNIDDKDPNMRFQVLPDYP